MGKVIRIVAATALVVLAGCQTAKVAYETEAKVSPAGVPDQYVVEFRITKMVPGAEPEVLSAPRITVLKDQQAECMVGDESDQVKCTALVSDGKGSVTATTSVSVKEQGRIAWSGKQTLKVSH